jgi:hypothetical protein
MKRQSTLNRDHRAAQQDDAAWFKANPDRTYRLRRPHDVELRDTERPAAATASHMAYTVVGQVWPGYRLRTVCWSGTEMIDAEELAHDLFHQLVEPFQGPRAYVLLPKPKPPALYLAYDREDQA